MKKWIFTAVLLFGSLGMFGQGARNIKINEVMTVNSTGLQDDYGQRLPWVELANVSYSTYNIRDMYITTDRRALDKSLSAPERIALMSVIPSGDERTTMSGRAHLIFFLNTNPTHGALHLSAQVNHQEPVWIALYDGNGIDLIDSVTVPTLAPDCSYARYKDGSTTWEIKSAEAVTPGISNFTAPTETKIAKWKRDDPHGIVVTVLSMGIVFACLALLYIVFRLLGIVIVKQRTLKNAGRKQPIKAVVKTGEKIAEAGHKTVNILQDGVQTKGIDKEIYIAVIAMALKQYQEDVHDVESGIITINTHHSHWSPTS